MKNGLRLELELAFGHPVMAQVHGNILRFDVGRLQVNDIEVFAQADDVARIFKCRRAFTAVEVGDVRCAADRRRS